MDRQHGPYLYKDGWKAEKRFSADGSSTRTFTVLIAAAYNAGIIGSEHNGIAVLDEDNQTLVLDQHLREGSGYFGPSARQKAEYTRVMAMDWKAFSEFCRTNPGFKRGSAPDIEAGAAPHHVEEDGLREAIRTGKASEDGKDIRTAEMKYLDDPSIEVGGLKFLCRTREQMIVHLARHEMDRSGRVISWNIKVRNFDRSGKGGEKTDPRFDARWEEYLEGPAGEQIFWQACEDELRQYVENEYTTYPGSDQGAYKFGVTGRSGGYLYLRSWDGPEPGSGHDPMKFEGRRHFVEYLRELSPNDLCRLYKLVANVDHDVKERGAAIAYHFSVHRAALEQEWAAEMAPTP
jgi:hypothetical protein